MFRFFSSIKLIFFYNFCRTFGPAPQHFLSERSDEFRRGSRNFRQRGSNFPKILKSKKKKTKKKKKQTGEGEKTKNTEGCGGFSLLQKQGDIYLKGDASIPKNPLIGGLFTCHKNPSAPSALSRPLTVLRCLMRFSPKARGSFEAGVTPPGHVCVLINLV